MVGMVEAWHAMVSQLQYKMERPVEKGLAPFNRAWIYGTIWKKNWRMVGMVGMV